MADIRFIDALLGGEAPPGSSPPQDEEAHPVGQVPEGGRCLPDRGQQEVAAGPVPGQGVLEVRARCQDPAA